MQTFLPYADFTRSAQCLDWRRLGKQRVEVLQILRTLCGESDGWRNHPAVKMWNGYTEALVEYGCAVCDEWARRGYRDNCRDKIVELSYGNDVVCPLWFGDEAFHASHRSNLLRKNPEWYGQFGWSEPPTLEYVWPISS